MLAHDDELVKFEKEGAFLPECGIEGTVENEGAKIWYSMFGKGIPITLLHGGNGHSGNWAYQVPALVEAGYQVITIDTRGHGRSTRDSRDFKYELLAADLVAVLDHLNIEKSVLVGWSDGACIAMIAAIQRPERVLGVYFFACNMDPSGTKEFKFTPVIGRCFNRHVADYKTLSSTPDDFEAFGKALNRMMETEPNYSADQLRQIRVRNIAIVIGENDEFIDRTHMDYLVESIADAQLIVLPEVSHFAPLQRPDEFNGELINYLNSCEL